MNCINVFGLSTRFSELRYPFLEAHKVFFVIVSSIINISLSHVHCLARTELNKNGLTL